MKTMNYTVSDKLGLHARPAGLLVKLAKEFESRIELVKGDNAVDATKLFAVMGMNVKCGETVTVNVNGSDEEIAFAKIEKFFAENL